AGPPARFLRSGHRARLRGHIAHAGLSGAPCQRRYSILLGIPLFWRIHHRLWRNALYGGLDAVDAVLLAIRRPETFDRRGLTGHGAGAALAGSQDTGADSLRPAVGGPPDGSGIGECGAAAGDRRTRAVAGKNTIAEQAV